LCLAGAHPEIHLLITDVIMPGMNGRELAGRLRTSHPNIEIMYMSGYTADVIAHRGVLEQGTHFLQKPFSLTDLAAAVRTILE
jgi:YesN/AraC family two-component response regulator